MSYNNNQYPYYPQNNYNQAPTSNSTYNENYGGSGQTGSSGSYYQQNSYGSQNNAQYGAAPNQSYNTGGTQQGNNSLSNTQQASSMTYLGSIGAMSSYNQPGYQATPTSQSAALSYSAGSGRSSPAMTFGTSRTTDHNSRANKYSAASGFSQSAARSTAQTSSTPQHSLYSTAQAPQNTMATSSQTQQGYNRAHQATPQQSLNPSFGTTSQTYQTNAGRASSYASPTMQTNPQLAQSHNKNIQPTAHSRTPSGMTIGPPAPPARPASKTQMRPSQVPNERPSSTDPSTIQATMQQLAQVPWQDRSQSQTPLQTQIQSQTQGHAQPQPQTQSQTQAAPSQTQTASTEMSTQPAAPQEKPAKKKGGRPVGSKNAPKDPNAPPTAKGKGKKKAANVGNFSAASTTTPGQAESAPADDMTAMFAKISQLKQTDPAKFAQLMAQIGGDVPSEPAAAASTPNTNVPAAVPATAISTSQPALPDKAAKKPTPNKQGSASKKGPSFVDLTEQTASKVKDRVAQSKAAGRGTEPWTPGSGLPPYQSTSAERGISQGTDSVPPIPPEYQRSQPTPTPAQPVSVVPQSATVAAQRPASSQSGAAPATATSTGGTFWPEDRRQGLALATKRFLEAVPENKGKVVNIHDVHQLLAQNPSYEQLCQILDGQGWKFQRSKFAQHLIATINSRERQQPANISRPLVSSQNKVVRPGDYQHSSYAPVRSPEVAGQAQDSQKVRLSDISVGPLNAASPALDSPARAPQFYSPTTEAPPIAPPERMAPMKESRSSSVVKTGASPAVQTPIPEPKNKEEAARKRTFADFVDLTEQDEEDEAELELERERKRRALEQPVERFVEKPMPQEPPRPSPWQQAAHRFDRFRNLQGVAGMTSAREALKNDTVVKPLDHAKAKRASRYDPKTIARDFFLAKGEHPTMKPLNHHYEGFFSTFSSVKIDSDLETFRWDLVDPGLPIPDPDEPDLHKSRKSISSGREEYRSSKWPSDKEGTRSAHHGSGGSDDEDVVGTMILYKKDDGERTKNGSDTLKRGAKGNGEGNESHQLGTKDFGSERRAGSSQFTVAAPSRPSNHLTAIAVPPVPSNFEDVVERVERGEAASPSHHQRADSMAGLGSIRRGRPPKRGRGRPSRGTGLTRADSTSFQQASTPPHSATQTPSSFTPINKAATSTHRTFSAPSNAIDDLSAGGLNALDASQTPGKRGPGRPRNSTPMSNSLSVIVPTSDSGQLLDKHGNPAKTYSSGKRLGRPPGSKNKFPSNATASASDRGSPSIRDSSDAPLKRKPGRPLGFRPGPRGSSTRGRGRG